MTTHDRVRLQLQALEALLREHQHSRNDEPQPHQFNSTQPFFMDTMEPLEWLQWVLIPRMHDLLDNKQPLPGAFAVAPYYEMALATDHPQRALIIPELEILYQDEWLVAVNKPSGWLVHRSWLDRDEKVVVMQTVRDQIGQHVFTAHRLDRPTSGVLLMGLSSEAGRLLAQQFEQHQIQK